MQFEKRGEEWWIVDSRLEDHGPYVTKTEAHEDQKGLKKFIRYCLKDNCCDEFCHVGE